MFEFKSPKYYAEMRAERRKLQASSSKLLKHQAASPKPRTTSFKLQAGSYKLSDP